MEAGESPTRKVAAMKTCMQRCLQVVAFNMMPVGCLPKDGLPFVTRLARDLCSFVTSHDLPKVTKSYLLHTIRTSAVRLQIQGDTVTDSASNDEADEAI